MSHHERSSCPLLLCDVDELSGEFPPSVAVEGSKVRDPKPVEGREQQQWIFGRFAQGFRLFDQQTCPLRRALVSGAA